MHVLKSFLKLCAFAIAGVGLTAPASAAFNFEAGAATPAGPGSVSIPIYLHETTTSVIASNDGLFSIGVSISRQTGDATITSFTRNLAFDQSNPGTVNNVTSAFINAQQDSNFGNGVVPDGNGLILFGTAVIAQGTSSSQFGIFDFGAGDQTVHYGFAAIDDSIVSGNFTVTAVPEPTTVALALLALPMALRRRR